MAHYGSLPFAEALGYLKAKLNLPTQRWDDLLGAAHDRAFVVAGAMQADLLADLHAAVNKVREHGTTLAEFKKDFEKIVAERGWTGWTGEGSKAGRAWRARVIYETNLQTSTAAGRYQQMQAIASRRPYWRYRHNDAVTNPRPEHVAWDGKVLRADDPWWSTHYPPCGFGCRCFVESLSERDVERLGLEPTKGEDMPCNGTVERVSTKTGEVITLPQGVDKGWDYAPGRAWYPDLEKYPYSLAKGLVAGMMRDGIFDRWHARIAQQVAEELAKPDYAKLSKKAVETRLRQQLDRKEEFPVAVMPPEMMTTLGVSVQTVLLSEYDAIKQAYSRLGDPNFTANAYRAVQSIFETAELIVRETDQATVWFRDQEDRLHVAVLWQTKTGQGLFLKSLRFGSENDKRRAKKAGTVLLEKQQDAQE